MVNIMSDEEQLLSLGMWLPFLKWSNNQIVKNDEHYKEALTTHFIFLNAFKKWLQNRLKEIDTELEGRDLFDQSDLFAERTAIAEALTLLIVTYQIDNETLR